MLSFLRDKVGFSYILSVPLLLAALGMSVFFIGTDSPWFAPALMCLTLAGLCSFIPAWREGIDIPKSMTFGFVAMFWVYLIISSFWSTVPQVSTLFTIIYSVLPAWFILSVTALNREKWVTVHACALLAVVFGFAVWAVIQFFFFLEEYGPRIRHPMLNPNNLAGLFNLALLPSIGLFFIVKKAHWQIAAVILVSVLYFGLIVTQSRGGFLAFLISSAVLMLFVAVRNPDGVPWLRITVFVALCLAISMFANLFYDGLIQKSLIGGKDFMNSASVVDRVKLWESTWEMIKDYGWFGLGLATFYFYYPRYRHPTDQSDGFFTHMDPLQLWAETGILAYILFYGVMICVLCRTVAALRHVKGDVDKRIAVIAPFCGMLALTGHTHITFHLYMPPMLIGLATLLAFWFIVTERIFDESGDFKKSIRIKLPQHKTRKWAMLFSFCLIALIANIWTVRLAVSTLMFKDVNQIAAKGDRRLAEAKLEQACMLSPPSYVRCYELRARFAISDVQNLLQKNDIEAARSRYEEGMREINKAISLNPAFEMYQDLKAQLYMVGYPRLDADGKNKAIDMLRSIVKTNPLRVDSRVGLARVYKADGEIDKAFAVLREGEKWPRPKGVPDLNFLLEYANILRARGEDAAYIRVINEAQRRAKIYGMTISGAP